MESRNKFILTITISIVIVIVGFFILGLDKVLIKPLILKDYAISNTSLILDRSKSLIQVSQMSTTH